MNLNDFLKAWASCKMSLVHTGQVSIKVTANAPHTHYTLYNEVDVCPHCHRVGSIKGIEVTFKKPERLTIFTAALLYDVFVEHKKPADYARFHECQAGKEFIVNLDEVKPV